MVLQALSALTRNPMAFGMQLLSIVLASIAVYASMDAVTHYLLPFQSINDAIGRLPAGISSWLQMWASSIKSGIILGTYTFLMGFYPNGLL